MKKHIISTVLMGASKSASTFTSIGYLHAIVFMIMMVLFSSCMGDDPEVVSDIQEDFSGIRSVEVEGGFLDVSYAGSAGQQAVRLDAKLKAESSTRSHIKYELVGDKLLIKLKTSGGSIRRASGHIKLVGPEDINLKLHASSGTISVEGIKNGTADFSVSSGKIFVSGIETPIIRLTTSSGDILGEDLKGNIVSSLSSGSLSLNKIIGNIGAEGSSGKMIFNQVTGRVDAKASSGKINMDQVTELGRFEISSGQIVGVKTRLGPDTQFKASSGTISIQTESNLEHFNFNLSTSSGGVKVGENNSSGTLVINNGSTHTVVGQVSSGKIQIVN